MEGFTTETITEAVRVVWSHEETTRNERIAGQWETTETVSDWLWGTTIEQPLTSSEIVGLLGHDRWKIENEGFNELVTHWHTNHYFHHHANSILVLWLMLFMAHAIFHCFHKRNLKPAQRKHRTVIYFAKLVAAANLRRSAECVIQVRALKRPAIDALSLRDSVHSQDWVWNSIY